MIKKKSKAVKRAKPTKSAKAHRPARSKGNNVNMKVCGKECPRCNDPDNAYCITKIPVGGSHSDPHSCGKNGCAW